MPTGGFLKSAWQFPCLPGAAEKQSISVWMPRRKSGQACRRREGEQKAEYLSLPFLLSRSALSDSLSPHALQHARLLCPPPSPWVFSNSCQLVGYASQPPRTLLPPSPFAFNLSQHQGLFKELALCIRWPKSQSSSFSIGPSNEYSDWFPLGLTSLISFDIKYTNDNSTTIFHLESSINQMRRVKYCPKA